MADNANLHPDWENLDEEEQQELIRQDQERQRQIQEKEAKTLADAGVPQFKSYEDLIRGYKDLNDEDKVVFPIVKKIAAKLNMTPHQFVRAIEAKAEAATGGKPGEGKPGSDTKSEDALKAIADRTELETKLQNRFLRFQMKMEKDGTEIPDGMYDDLVTLMPAVLMGKNKEQIQALDWFGTAYKLYLFNLGEGDDLEKVRDKLSAHDKKQLEKLKQLGVPQGGGKGGKGPTEDQKTWGTGIDSLPEPKKK